MHFFNAELPCRAAPCRAAPCRAVLSNRTILTEAEVVAQTLGCGQVPLEVLRSAVGAVCVRGGGAGGCSVVCGERRAGWWV